MLFLTTFKQMLLTYENIRDHVKCSMMVFSFSRLDLPQQSYGSIKTCGFCTKLYNSFMLKVILSDCHYPSDFRKSVPLALFLQSVTNTCIFNTCIYFYANAHTHISLGFA